MHLGMPISRASEDLPLVSPPLQVVEETFVSDLCSTPSKFLASTSYATSHSTTDTTPSGSPACLSVTSIALEDHETGHRKIQTSPTASSDRSRNGETSSFRESENNGEQKPILAHSDENTVPMDAESSSKAQKQAIKTGTINKQNADGILDQERKTKVWFDVLPLLLENIKSHDHEKIKELMLPRCVHCKRSKIENKAALQCKHTGCVVLDFPLCLRCWKSYHSLAKAQTHRRQYTSACPLCQLDWIAYWCADCDLNFCKQCFEHIHTVSAVKSHRKIAMEDAPGTCLATSRWSSYFQNAIVSMIASQKQKMKDSTDGGSAIGAKRKRKIEETVVVDNEEDAGEENASSMQSNNTLIDENVVQAAGSCEIIASELNGSSTGAENGYTTRLSNARCQPQQNASVTTYSPTSAPQHSMLVVVPRPEEATERTSTPVTPLAQQARSPYSTASTPNSANPLNSDTNVGRLQWDASTYQCRASSQMGGCGSTTAFTTSTTSNGMMHVISNTMPTVTNGSCSTTSTISRDLASTYNSNDSLLPGGAVFAENMLIDSLVDRYHEVNQSVSNMELRTEQLSKQIAVATCEGPYNARPFVTMLSNLQPIVKAARKRRDQLLIAIIIQSSDILSSVRLLRVTELGDVPQVSLISHRKCLQLSNAINQHKKHLIELHQRLSDTLNHSHGISSSWENRLIQTTSTSIQINEESITNLKKVRKVEIVRIVQFSHNIRKMLKQAFQRVADFHRQKLQQQQPQSQPMG